MPAEKIELFDSWMRIQKLPKNFKANRTLADICRLDIAKHGYALADVVLGYLRERCAIEAKECADATTKRLWHELYWDVMLTQAEFNFDAFMLYTEKDRQPVARFYSPRRKVLEGMHGLSTKINNFIESPTMKFLGFSMPPGTGKTTYLKFLLSYIALRFSQSANMYISYAGGMVKMMQDSLRAILTDRTEYKCHEIFPALGDPIISSEYNTISYRPDGDFPTIGLGSLGGSITGRTRANKFLVTDDLVKNKEVARSPQQLQTLWENYQAVLTTRLIGDQAKQIMLGTVWSKYDPISLMKEKHGHDTARYEFISIPVRDEVTRKSNFNYEHPDRYSGERIAELEEEMDPIDFSCMYLQTGLEKLGIAFPRDELRYYPGVLPDGEPDNVYFFCDVAWGGGDSLSMPIAFEYGKDIFIHDWIFDSNDKHHTRPRVEAAILRNKCKMGRFEANNGGDEYADIVRKHIMAEGWACNITHKKSTSDRSKDMRIEQYAPDIKRMYFIDAVKPPKDGSALTRKYRTPEYERAMTELTTYSYTGVNLHDDAPDSMAGLAEFNYRGQPAQAVLFDREYF